MGDVEPLYVIVIVIHLSIKMSCESRGGESRSNSDSL